MLFHPTAHTLTFFFSKTRDRFEQDCLRIKGYLAQGHMVMGQEERKNKAKLEKTQIQLASNSNEYEAAVKTLEETTGRWNKEWKAACDVCYASPTNNCPKTNVNPLSQKFQDLEEERLDFTKSSLWTYANIASTVCVSDDAVCTLLFRLHVVSCTNIQHSPARKSVYLLRTARLKRISSPSSRNEEQARKSQTPLASSTSARMMTTYRT